VIAILLHYFLSALGKTLLDHRCGRRLFTNLSRRPLAERRRRYFFSRRRGKTLLILGNLRIDLAKKIISPRLPEVAARHPRLIPVSAL